MAKGRKTGGKPPIIKTETHKQCSDCREVKPFKEFYPEKNNPHGYGWRCISCSKARGKIYREKNPELKKRKDRIYYKKNPLGTRNAFLKRTYGIDLIKYNQMFSDQSGRCAICGRHQSELKKTLAVDHCHETGKIRALLCGFCNTTLGKFEDREDLLLKCIDYIGRYK